MMLDFLTASIASFDLQGAIPVCRRLSALPPFALPAPDPRFAGFDPTGGES